MNLAFLASIPSPSRNTIDIGPVSLTFYGMCIGLGIIAATYLARHRLAQQRIHPDTAVEMLLWAIPAGMVGARLYHVITDSKSISEWHKVWEGGLGVPGAIAAGAIGVLLFIRNRGLPRATVIDAVIPGIPLAQAIGRWGNWFNQELFGRPTELPWGLEIPLTGNPATEHRPLEFRDDPDMVFHPTFLYESLWNLGLVLLLIWIGRKGFLKPGKLVWVYTGGYAIGRLWIESLRIDNATEIAGVRINIWTMSIVLLVSLFMLRNARADAASQGASADSAKHASTSGAGKAKAGAAAAASGTAVAKSVSKTATAKKQPAKKQGSKKQGSKGSADTSDKPAGKPAKKQGSKAQPDKADKNSKPAKTQASKGSKGSADKTGEKAKTDKKAKAGTGKKTSSATSAKSSTAKSSKNKTGRAAAAAASAAAGAAAQGTRGDDEYAEDGAQSSDRSKASEDE